ncbi:hypothetical protein C2E23DRAFT_806233 [Lenzites betulinus]|nr:hypothetical protein C2E23DRAFT_806233 [Lenzites betulinus]
MFHVPCSASYSILFSVFFDIRRWRVWGASCFVHHVRALSTTRPHAHPPPHTFAFSLSPAHGIWTLLPGLLFLLASVRRSRRCPPSLRPRPFAFLLFFLLPFLSFSPFPCPSSSSCTYFLLALPLPVLCYDRRTHERARDPAPSPSQHPNPNAEPEPKTKESFAVQSSTIESVLV